MKKVFKTLAVVLCLLLVIPVFSACKDKQLVLSQIQSSGKEIERGEGVYLQTTYGNSVLENPDTRIVYDSHAQGEAVSASIQDNVLTISQDAEVGAVIRVQSFYNKQNSNVLEFVVVHKEVDKISFNADDIRPLGENEFETTKAPGEEIRLKDVVQILPEYASHVEDGVEKNYTVADLQFEVISSDADETEYQVINSQGSVDLGVKILETATKGYEFTIHVSIKNVHAYLHVTVAEEKPTLAWKQNAFNVYHGTTVLLEDLVDFYPGNEDSSSKLSVEFMISSYSETSESLKGVFTIDGSSLNIAHYASQATINASCYIIAKVVGYDGETIQTQAVPFTIRNNELVRVEIKEEYQDKPIAISTANIYKLQDYITLVGQIAGADITTDINTNTLQIMIENKGGVDDAYFFTDVNTMRFGIRPFSSLQNTQTISLKFKVGTNESELLSFVVTESDEIIKLQLDNGIGEILGEKDIYAGTYQVSFVCYAGGNVVPTELCNLITLQLADVSSENVIFTDGQLIIGEDVPSEHTFAMQYVVNKGEPQTIVTFTVKNTNSLTIYLDEDTTTLGGSGIESDPYKISTEYSGAGPFIKGEVTLNGVVKYLPEDISSLDIKFEVLYSGDVSDFVNVGLDQDWGKMNTENIKLGGSVSVQIQVKNADGGVICSSNTLYFNFVLVLHSGADLGNLNGNNDIDTVYVVGEINTMTSGGSILINKDIVFIGYGSEASILGSINCMTDGVQITFENLQLGGSIILNPSCNISITLSNVSISMTQGQLVINNFNQEQYNKVSADWEEMFTVSVSEPTPEGVVNVTLTPKSEQSI